MAEKRSPKHGVIFLVSVETGEVYCHECMLHKKGDVITTGRYKKWYEQHAPKCSINYEGSSGAMECQAGVDMFIRSISTRNLRYSAFVGDGDSACYTKVRDARADIYGESFCVVKEECLGHIQKRMGSGLREYKQKMRGQKLDDNKSVGGAGRLTDAFIDRMQNNYDEAIRNHNEVNSMKTAILAVYNHMIKDDDLSLVQQHKYRKTGRIRTVGRLRTGTYHLTIM